MTLSKKSLGALKRWNGVDEVPTKEQLTEDKNNGLSQVQMGKKYNLSKTMISKLLKEYNIDTTNPKTAFNKIPKEILIEEIFVNKLTYNEIAKKYGRTKPAIKHMSKFYGIKAPDNRPNKSERHRIELESKIINDYGILTKIELHKKYKVGQLFIDKILENTPNKFFKESTQEKEMSSFLEDNNIKIIKHYKLKSGKELDIFIPSHNIAIEMHGIYWHSSAANRNNLYPNYHRDKQIESENEGIKLFQIFEDEWTNNSNIWKSIILRNITPQNKIFARKCEIRKPTIKEAREFFDVNHLQGYIPSNQYYGIYYNNELISAISFGKSRFNKRYEWEILRYATKINTLVVGGFSKLFKTFIKEHNPKNVVTYADLRFSVGDVYLKNGFNFVNKSSPNYFYTKGHKRINRVVMQKHKLENKLENFNPSLTEKENVLNNGYGIIYDCGNLAFEWKNG